MRFLLYTATFWTVLFLGVVAFDVGYTLTTGTQASPAVTRHIDFTPDGGGLLGWMGRLSREMDRMGDSPTSASAARAACSSLGHSAMPSA